ncbi:MAG: hypothetical protein LBH80_04320 [Prevotellaceae bacterium]|jgi:hypothetical protein|nr:hypothetical protein [Prevotellaceae bacterium]
MKNTDEEKYTTGSSLCIVVVLFSLLPEGGDKIISLKKPADVNLCLRWARRIFPLNVINPDCCTGFKLAD